MTSDFYSELFAWIKETKPTKQELAKKKNHLCKKYKRKVIPTDIEIYLNASPEDAKVIQPYIVTKPTRTGSGVAIVAMMTKPFNCPHGSCTYCPGGLNSFFGDVPKSYTGKEPSTMRSIRNAYDPYRIVFNRLEQYLVLGQNPQKVDQIVQGGTFPAFPKKYQEEYIHACFKAYNDFSRLFYPNGTLDLNTFKAFFELPGDINDTGRTERLREKILAQKEQNKKTLKEEHQLNETSAIRCIGLTIETKPDWGLLKHGLLLLELGTTRIELGIQTVYEEILKKVNRGHTLEHTKQSIADLRDLGFKLNFHMMPGLPSEDGTRISYERDLASLKTIFDDPAYRPDMLKIYPCMVMPGTALEKDFQAGIFKPITTDEAANLIVDAKRFIPEYCRIMRIQRDIPTYVTQAGVDKTNLRQYVDELAKKHGVVCRCIRCREVRTKAVTSQAQIIVRAYEASNGKEFFISAEADDALLGFVRLRIPERALHPVITQTSALIRELHVYGSVVPLGDVDQTKVQHKGIGRKLMERAEAIAKENGRDKMVVISGVGVRDYYRKLGYELEGPYMVKKV